MYWLVTIISKHGIVKECLQGMWATKETPKKPKNTNPNKKNHPTAIVLFISEPFSLLAAGH